MIDNERSPEPKPSLTEALWIMAALFAFFLLILWVAGV